MELHLGDTEGKNSYCRAQQEVGPRSRWEEQTNLELIG